LARKVVTHSRVNSESRRTLVSAFDKANIFIGETVEAGHHASLDDYRELLARQKSASHIAQDITDFSAAKAYIAGRNDMLVAMLGFRS